jgi:FMN phosphatase YigB (HAD superfamily)
MTEIRAVCFDAFGTLVEITDKRQQFLTLLQGNVMNITAEEVLTAQSAGSRRKGKPRDRGCQSLGTRKGSAGRVCLNPSPA